MVYGTRSIGVHLGFDYIFLLIICLIFCRFLDSAFIITEHLASISVETYGIYVSLSISFSTRLYARIPLFISFKKIIVSLVQWHTVRSNCFCLRPDLLTGFKEYFVCFICNVFKMFIWLYWNTCGSLKISGAARESIHLAIRCWVSISYVKLVSALSSSDKVACS